MVTKAKPMYCGYKPCACSINNNDGKRYEKYWKLPCSHHTPGGFARWEMKHMRFKCPNSTPKERAVHLSRRATRGLIAHDGCKVGELKRFAKSHRLTDRRDSCTQKSHLIDLLEQSDDNLSFRFMGLPPELRVQVYHYYFASLKCVTTEPAPILSVCRIIRQEARPLFYENIRLMIKLQYDPSMASLMAKGPEQRLFRNPDIDVLQRVTKLRIKFDCTNDLWDIDLDASGEQVMVRHGCCTSWWRGRRFSEGDRDLVLLGMLRIAKEIADRPLKHKLQRDDVAKFAAPTLKSAVARSLGV